MIRKYDILKNLIEAKTKHNIGYWLDRFASAYFNEHYTKYTLYTDIFTKKEFQELRYKYLKKYYNL
jgi:hypothetical protein